MKILIANDGSKCGFAALEIAAEVIGANHDAEIKVVCAVGLGNSLEMETYVLSVNELADPDNPAAQMANEICDKSVEILKSKTKAASLNISYEVLGGSIARAIVEKAEGWGADLIIIGSHGYGFWKRSWLGSVSTQVLNHAPCSVLVVREKES